MQTSSILGESQLKVPLSGKIRSGIMVLTKKAQNHAQAEEIRKLYDWGVRQEYPWKYTGNAIKNKLKLDFFPLTPINTIDFHARACDFDSRPEIPKEIMETHGEPSRDENDAEGTIKLYGFPIVLPSDDWLQCVPHSLQAWKASGWQYRSEYDQDGQRWCKTKSIVPRDPKSRRFKRTFGGVPVINRPDTNEYNQGGKCDPDQCPEYQNQVCNLSAQLYFELYGLPNPSGIIGLPTNSFYAMSRMRAEMELVMHNIGHISGLHNGEPIFWISKRIEEVPMFDRDQGKTIRVKQIITTLEHKVSLIKETPPMLDSDIQDSPQLTHDDQGEYFGPPIDADQYDE